jgi:hypothetical protein
LGRRGVCPSGHEGREDRGDDNDSEDRTFVHAPGNLIAAVNVSYLDREVRTTVE